MEEPPNEQGLGVGNGEAIPPRHSPVDGMQQLPPEAVAAGPAEDMIGSRAPPMRSQSSFRARVRAARAEAAASAAPAAAAANGRERAMPVSLFEWESRGHFWSALDKASAPVHPANVKNTLGAKLGRWRQTMSVRGQNTLTVIRMHPAVLLLPLLLCGACIGLGIMGIKLGTAQYETRNRDEAEVAAGQVASSLRLTLERALQPLRSLDPIVQLRPAMAALGPAFPRIADKVLAQALPNTVLEMCVAPFGTVRAVHPQPPGGGAPSLGAPLFAGAELEAVLGGVAQQDILLRQPQGHFLPYLPAAAAGRFLAAHHPVFLTNVSAGEDWGNGEAGAFGSCASCWDPRRGAKLWGYASSLLDVGAVLALPAAGLGRLRELQYLYRLSIPSGQAAAGGADPAAPLVLAVSSPAPPSAGDLVGVAVSVPSAVWLLEVYHDRGWTPGWAAPLTAIVVVVSLAMAVLLFMALVIHHRHLMLLEAMLPKKVIKTLGTGRSFYEHFDAVTLLYADIVRYSNAPTGMPPWEVVKLLNDVNNLYDGLLEKHGLVKIRRSGEAFMGVGGCPIAEDPVKSALRVALCAREMVLATAGFRSSAGQRVQIRIGLHSGPVVAAVVGTQMPRFSLFGDTVDIAHFMEATSTIMGVHVSDTTAELLAIGDDPLLMVQPRGIIDIKGRGPITTSWLRVNLLVPMATFRDGPSDRTSELGAAPGPGSYGGGGAASARQRNVSSGGGAAAAGGGSATSAAKDDGGAAKAAAKPAVKEADIACTADLAVAAAMGVRGAPLVRKLSNTGLTGTRRVLPDRRGGADARYDNSLLGSFTLRLEADTVAMALRMLAAPAVGAVGEGPVLVIAARKAGEDGRWGPGGAGGAHGDSGSVAGGSAGWAESVAELEELGPAEGPGQVQVVVAGDLVAAEAEAAGAEVGAGGGSVIAPEAPEAGGVVPATLGAGGAMAPAVLEVEAPEGLLAVEGRGK